MMRLFILIACVLAVLASPVRVLGYDEAFAKDAVMWSAGAYGSDPHSCPYNDDFVVDDVIEISKNLCLVGFSDKYSAIVISCRGTTGISQLTKEIMDSFPTPFPFDGYPSSASVLNYFYKHFIDTSPDVLSAVQARLEEYPGAKIICTGHSLGAALSTLHAAVIGTVYDNVELITFGSPRVGNWDFASITNSNLGGVKRVTHRKDSVVHIPWCPGGILPGAKCREMDDDAGWPAYGYHLSLETYYPGDMPHPTGSASGDYQSCTGEPLGEDPSCCDNWWLPDSIHDHTHYFDIDVGTYCNDHLRAMGFEGIPPAMTKEERAEDHRQAQEYIQLMHDQAKAAEETFLQ